MAGASSFLGGRAGKLHRSCLERQREQKSGRALLPRLLAERTSPEPPSLLGAALVLSVFYFEVPAAGVKAGLGTQHPNINPHPDTDPHPKQLPYKARLPSPLRALLCPVGSAQLPTLEGKKSKLK